MIFNALGGQQPDVDLMEMKMWDLQQTMHITKHRQTVEDISDTASKEYSNSNTMAKMKEDWKILEFTTVEMEGKNSPILSGEAVEILQQSLDDHIIKTQTMKGSPFAKFMLPEIEEWEKMLMTTSDNLDIWLSVQ